MRFIYIYMCVYYYYWEEEKPLDLWVGGCCACSTDSWDSRGGKDTLYFRLQAKEIQQFVSSVIEDRTLTSDL